MTTYTDASTLGFTGMTRDGTWRIENGEVTHPVVEMRWNETIPESHGHQTGFCHLCAYAR